MADFEFDSLLTTAREAASGAAYDVQQLPEDSIERQALHGVVTAIEATIAALDALAGDDSDD